MTVNKGQTHWQITMPGMMTTVQDEGRVGFQQYGMPVAGAMDGESYRLGQRLVGNDVWQGALECTVMGPSFVSDGEAVVAFTGADMRPAVNGEAIPMNRAVRLRAGDEVSCGIAEYGVRMYIAVRGGIRVPPVNGSASTHSKSGIGGFEGRPLKKRDVLTVSNDSYVPPLMVADNYVGPFTAAPIRVVPGPQHERFTAEAWHTLTSSAYVITPMSDRMGYRLAGAALTHTDGADIISDGAVFGSIQVPSDGQPIILMADRQTTGGYTKIGTVITPDLPRLAQMPVGTSLTFDVISVQAAQQLYRAYKEREAAAVIAVTAAEEVASTGSGAPSILPWEPALPTTRRPSSPKRTWRVAINNESFDVTVEAIKE